MKTDTVFFVTRICDLLRKSRCLNVTKQSPFDEKFGLSEINPAC